MLKTAYKLSIICLLLFAATSCIKDVDFDQAGDLEITSALEASLIHFNAQAPQFYDETIASEITIRDSVRIDIFNDPFVVDNLLRAEFLFETTNSISRAFSTEVVFLNDNDVEQYMFEFITPASPTNEELLFIHEEIFTGVALDNLKATSKLVLILTMQSGSIPIDNNSIGFLKLRSKANFLISVISPE